MSVEDLFVDIEQIGQPQEPPKSMWPPPPKPGRLYRFLRDAWSMDVEPQPHATMANFIERHLGDCSFDGDTQTLIMLGVPRDTYKTTMAEGASVYILNENNNAKILFDGFRHSVAKARLRAVRRKIERDPVLDKMCGTMKWKPQFREDVWNDEEIIITPRTDTTSREASIATAGVDRSMNSQHFDVIFADDVVTDTNARTFEGRQRVYDHILDLLPILKPGGVLIIIFTTWHVDDAYMRFMRADEEKIRQGLEPMFAEKMIRGCYDGPSGLFFPTRHNHQYLANQRERMGSRKFSAQYLLKPMADEDKTFLMDATHAATFQFFSVRERETGGLVRMPSGSQWDVETAISWDPAGRKPNRTSDSHGIIVNGTDIQDRWWTLEAASVKLPPMGVIGHLIRYITVYRPWAVSCEDAFGSGLWLDMLREECIARGVHPMPIFIEWSTGGIPKPERIMMLQPRWERGDWVMRQNPDGSWAHPDLYRQLDAFSSAGIDHEDVLDSYVQHLTLRRKPSDAPLTMEEVNPLDPEFTERLKRERADLPTYGDPRRSRAGRFGHTWE